MTERATQHLIERFSPYLPGDPRNATPKVLQGEYGGPLPEYWISREDLGLAPGFEATTQPIDATGSHGWNAVGLVWMHKRLLGVTIATPGGSELRIAPNAGGLADIEGTTMTPNGAVTVAWTPASLMLKISLPKGVSAHVLLPGRLASMTIAEGLQVPSTCRQSEDGSYACTGSKLVFSGWSQEGESL